MLGAGLAGSALAWQAHWRGKSVAVIDRIDMQSSSRVAAGLVTPITGSRAAASWRWNEFYAAANAHYSRAQKVLGASFWSVEPALRIFRSQADRELFESKWYDTANIENTESIVARPIPPMTECGLKTPYGVGSMEPAARLDTVAYLNATQIYFSELDSFYRFDLNCDRDIVFDSTNSRYPVRIASLPLAGSSIVFCQGMAARENRFFMDLPLHPARGDILVVRSPIVQCDSVLHHDAWVVPIGEQCYLVGATYDRFLQTDPSQADPSQASHSKDEQFRQELMRRWESLVQGSFHDGQHAVVEQRWAVRPASYDRHPLIGSHPRQGCAYCLNGLGSKGTLMSPRLAEMVINAIDGATIDPMLLSTRRK